MVLKMRIKGCYYNVLKYFVENNYKNNKKMAYHSRRSLQQERENKR
jgi:hypothetical protein